MQEERRLPHPKEIDESIIRIAWISRLKESFNVNGKILWHCVTTSVDSAPPLDQIFLVPSQYYHDLHFNPFFPPNHALGLFYYLDPTLFETKVVNKNHY